VCYVQPGVSVRLLPITDSTEDSNGDRNKTFLQHLALCYLPRGWSDLEWPKWSERDQTI